jgi:hypothetical protein
MADEDEEDFEDEEAEGSQAAADGQ